MTEPAAELGSTRQLEKYNEARRKSEKWGSLSLVVGAVMLVIAALIVAATTAAPTAQVWCAHSWLSPTVLRWFGAAVAVVFSAYCLCATRAGHYRDNAFMHLTSLPFYFRMEAAGTPRPPKDAPEDEPDPTDG
jgi:uncharacterized integral membrane protein